METSLYMIKPDGMEHVAEIRTLIGKKLTISERKVLILPEWAINELYGGLSANLQRVTRAAFGKGPVELGLVCGENAIGDLVELTGDQTASAACHPASIRYRFGTKEPVAVGSEQYFLNAIHRPKNQAEAEKNIALFARL